MLAIRGSVASCRMPFGRIHAAPRQHRVVLHRAAAVSVKDAGKESTSEVVFAEEAFEDSDYPEVLPTTEQIHGFLRTLVAETEIAEVHLRMGSFELKVKRSLTVGGAAPPPAAAAPAAAALVLPHLDMLPTGVASSSFQSMQSPLESVDESLIYVTSPKVGIIRRGRYQAGKRVGKGNVVNEGDQVKRGQTLAFVEQLGTYVPVEAPQAGELVRFEVEDGGAVEYGQMVVQLAPYFGGHIIGDKKFA